MEARYCPWCLRGVERVESVGRVAVERVEGVERVEEDHEIPAVESRTPSEWQGTAVYELELPVKCPHCLESIRAVRVLQLTRTKVAFTSMLPRGGRVIVCPRCEQILSADIAGLI